MNPPARIPMKLPQQKCNVFTSPRTTRDYMKDVTIPEAIRHEFHVFPRTNNECQDWQKDSEAYKFPYKEAGLG